MATQYLIFPSEAAAINASQADWAQRVLHHPTLGSSFTSQLWGIISNSAGTIGVIADNIPMSGLSASEQAALVDATDLTVVAVLAEQGNIAPVVK